MDYSDWIDYYERRARSNETDLRRLSGYDHRMAAISDLTLKNLVESIASALRLSKSDRLLDVGCGAGVLTVPLMEFAGEVVGVDASPSMLARIGAPIRVFVAQGNSLPFGVSAFDKVLCHSVFQYFPSLEYAKDVLLEFHRVCHPGGLFYIVDVPDMDLKAAYLAKKEPDRHGLHRLFYSRSFFLDLFPGCNILSNDVPGYENSKFRFNVLVEKQEEQG